MDIGGPLRGTWLTVLVISIAFAAAGVAAAEPWSAPGGEALSAGDVPAAVASSTDGAATPVPQRSERPPAAVASRPTDVVEVTSSSDSIDEGALWVRQENHGYYVSSQAKGTAGTGNRCAVSDVARSDVGKPETAKSDPSSTTGACEEPASASDRGDDDKGASASDKGNRGSDRGAGASDKGEGDE